MNWPAIEINENDVVYANAKQKKHAQLVAEFWYFSFDVFIAQRRNSKSETYQTRGTTVRLAGYVEKSYAEDSHDYWVHSSLSDHRARVSSEVLENVLQYSSPLLDNAHVQRCIFYPVYTYCFCTWKFLSFLFLMRLWSFISFHDTADENGCVITSNNCF